MTDRTDEELVAEARAAARRAVNEAIRAEQATCDRALSRHDNASRAAEASVADALNEIEDRLVRLRVRDAILLALVGAVRELVYKLRAHGLHYGVVWHIGRVDDALCAFSTLDEEEQT